MTLLVALLAGIFPVYTPGGYISLVVPLILEAAMVQVQTNQLLMLKSSYFRSNTTLCCDVTTDINT